MNVQMMEGLVGASTNLKMSGTPMSVYRQASAEGDTEKMKRALGYTGECTEKAAKYQKELDKGMKEETKTAREKVELAREIAVEKRREERRKTEAAAESSQRTDVIEISEAAKAAQKNEPAAAVTPMGDEPAIYTETGEVSPAEETKSTLSFSA